MRADRRENPLRRLILGGVLLTLGILFWLDRMGKLDVSDYYHLWPLLLIASGLAELARRRWAAALVWIFLGGMFMHGGGWEALRLVLNGWPLLISVAGMTLVIHALRSSRSPGAFRAAAVMAGNTRTVTSDPLAGGSAVAVMGGCQLDYSGSQNVTGDVTVDVLAFWGGIEIRVPAGWQVVDRVAPILGGFEDKTVAPRENATRLIVRGSAIMGGIEVRSAAEATV